MSNIIRRTKDLQVGRRAEGLAGGIEMIWKLLGLRAHRGRPMGKEIAGAMSRRQVLRASLTAAAALAAGAAGLGSLTGAAFADEAVKTGKFIFPRLKFAVRDGTGDIWNTGLIGDAILRKHLRELTNINISEEPKTIRLGDFDDLCQNPFVFMTSQGHFKLPDNEEKNLREFLERGGFIHADDCIFPSAKGKDFPSDLADDAIVKPRQEGDAADIDRFFRDYVVLINRLFPDNPMRRIPKDHEIYHVYYDFVKGCPHMQGVQHGAWGLFEPGTGRIMTLVSAGDLHCGWMDQYWEHEKNLSAIKMGINIIIYFLSH